MSTTHEAARALRAAILEAVKACPGMRPKVIEAKFPDVQRGRLDARLSEMIAAGVLCKAFACYFASEAEAKAFGVDHQRELDDLRRERDRVRAPRVKPKPMRIKTAPTERAGWGPNDPVHYAPGYKHTIAKPLPDPRYTNTHSTI